MRCEKWSSFLVIAMAMLTASPILPELTDFWAQARAPKVRTMRQWVEDELIIPEGQYKDERFRLHRQPFVGLLLDAIDSGNWTRFAVTGCVQGGKSLFGFVSPAAYHLFEHKDNVILGVPNTNVIGRDKWNNEIKPTVEASRYASLLPTRGVGSQGGWGNEVALGNGAKLKFMTGTGGDEARSSYTARVVVCTEADKMDRASLISREAGPIQQLFARSASWDLCDRLLFLECTVSHSKGCIWQEYTNGTASRIMCPCPHCREYVCPERDSLRGWQSAKDEIEAEEKAYFVCPNCEHKLTEKQRRDMNRRAVLIHRGQQIAKTGRITGPLPRTRTLGFRWNAFNNMFWSPGSIGFMEWGGARARDKDSAEKELRQFYWATPWDPPDIELAPLDPEDVEQRTAGYKQGIVPSDTIGISIGVDTGKRQLDWTAMAFTANPSGDPNGYIIDYGEQVVEADALGIAESFRKAFHALRSYFEGGWRREDGAILGPSQVWIDSGYHEHTPHVYQFCESVNRDCKPGTERYRPSKGHGEGQYMTRYITPKEISAKVRYIGTQFHFSIVERTHQPLVHVNSDYWKSQVHSRLAMPAKAPGSIVLFEAAGSSFHAEFVQQLLAEEQIEKWIPGKGTTTVWERVRRKNHKLDSTYAATAAGEFILREWERAQDAKPDESWFAKQKRKAGARGRTRA